MLQKYISPMTTKSINNYRLIIPRFNFVYNSLKISLFDVTLRDGLQCLTQDQQNKFTLEDKKKIFKLIYETHKPNNIEIGSIVSDKILPIFKDTLQLFDYLYQLHTEKTQINYYILIPNKTKLFKVLNNENINNLSFITSLSNSFQVKNTKMTLEESVKDISEMIFYLENKFNFQKKPNIKLYVSCINECPIEGKLNNDFIINSLLNFGKMNIENICLSDTCGSLELDDFEYIIKNCIRFGLSPSRLSLHLHVKSGREEIIEKIIHTAFDYKIVNFDVSMLKMGGCSVTMNKNDLCPNLSYELFCESLYNYTKKHY